MIVSGIFSGIVGGLVSIAIGWWASRPQRAVRPNRDGWKTLRPGFQIKLCIILPMMIVGFIAAFHRGGGSSLSDAEYQNDIAHVIGVAMGCAMLAFGWFGYHRDIAWRGNEIRVHRFFGRVEVFDILRIYSFDWDQSDQRVTLGFVDGRKLSWSRMFNGTDDLVEHIFAILPDVDDDDDRDDAFACPEAVPAQPVGSLSFVKKIAPPLP